MLQGQPQASRIEVLSDGIIDEEWFASDRASCLHFDADLELVFYPIVTENWSVLGYNPMMKCAACGSLWYPPDRTNTH
jgi:hypothetical protein